MGGVGVVVAGAPPDEHHPAGDEVGDRVSGVGQQRDAPERDPCGPLRDDLRGVPEDVHPGGPPEPPLVAARPGTRHA
jgi:hypothetical protein